MKVRHINCGTLCPLGGSLIDGQGSPWRRARMVCHCLLIETPSSGLLLVDTGLGLADVADPDKHLGRHFTLLTRPKLDPGETAAHQVERLGYRREDVRHIVPTHLDLDHAGGLPDFPQAQVHIYEPEYQAAMARPSFFERRRYRPHHWAHGPSWVRYSLPPDGERWFGFECVRGLTGLPPEILLVPLPGHTRGHAAIAVRTPQGWLLHAGDAFFFREEIDPVSPRCPAGLAAFQQLVQIDARARVANQERLRTLAAMQPHDVTIFCAHDGVQLEKLAARSQPERAAA